MDLTALSEQGEADLIVGFFDLRGFSKWCEDHTPQEIFELAAELFKRSSAYIDQAGGHLIKPIGDAGLFIFPLDHADEVVTELRAMRRHIDAWLKELDYPEMMSIKIRIGSVAPGYIKINEDQRFDIYGLTVNRAAMMKGWPFSISLELYEILNEETKAKFHLIEGGEWVVEE